MTRSTERAHAQSVAIISVVAFVGAIMMFFFSEGSMTFPVIMFLVLGLVLAFMAAYLVNIYTPRQHTESWQTYAKAWLATTIILGLVLVGVHDVWTHVWNMRPVVFFIAALGVGFWLRQYYHKKDLGIGTDLLGLIGRDRQPTYR